MTILVGREMPGNSGGESAFCMYVLCSVADAAGRISTASRMLGKTVARMSSLVPRQNLSTGFWSIPVFLKAATVCSKRNRRLVDDIVDGAIAVDEIVGTLNFCRVPPCRALYVFVRKKRRTTHADAAVVFCVVNAWRRHGHYI